MEDKKPKDIQQDNPGQGLRQGRADSYAGFVTDDQDGTSSIGSGKQQSGVNSNFAKASPESNVGPAGAAQSSHGNASGPIPGGVLGKSEDGQSSQSAIGGAATGGSPGTHLDHAAQDYVGRAGNDKISERLADGAESSGTPGDGPR
ncbi:hypothetical protein SOM61_21960 [Massilia sp. CFBP9012]|uniref:hypothetical protein n=1 Tax=Massilia sp. CFBP9012 TaxID=3096531 RepID=UPI002A69FF7A|nr:hypothetical protein [Massilia sp. CFBP9012]MDY0977635.1 hypothetical protein [Massilia sp. CFBP9012]